MDLTQGSANSRTVKSRRGPLFLSGTPYLRCLMQLPRLLDLYHVGFPVGRSIEPGVRQEGPEVIDESESGLRLLADFSATLRKHA